jgi:hypothetical protein
MYICDAEFGLNVKKYLDMALKEDVYIMVDGRPKLVISITQKEREKLQEVVDSLAGSLEYDGDVEELLEKRLDEL